MKANQVQEVVWKKPADLKARGRHHRKARSEPSAAEARVYACKNREDAGEKVDV